MSSSKTTWITPEQAHEALQIGTGAGVRVAVIDSGVDLSHPELQGLELEDDLVIQDDGVRVTVSESFGNDIFGHGTAIAGVIRKLAPETRLGSFRVLGERLNSRTKIIREGVRQAMDRGYHILNCSFGCRGEAKFIMDYKDWVDECYLKGIHIISACNNFDFTVPEWPGYFPSVVTTNMARTEYEGVLYFRPGHLVEFAARGDSIEVPWMGGGRKVVTGSSYAAPCVAALLARLLSVYPDLPPLVAKSLLHQVAEPWSRDIAASNVQPNAL